MLKKIRWKSVLLSLLGSAILAFGLYHVHSMSGVTEGGVLGMTLLFKHWLDVSPSLSGFVMNAICYIIGWRTLGKHFVIYSCISGVGFSAFYAVFEQFEPLWPQLSDMPLLAAVLGALFVGVGVGLCVREGGAPGGDDALAMSIAQITKKRIQWIYLISDLVVLVLSLSYIPVKRIIFSLLTVVISGQLIGWMQKIKKVEKRALLFLKYW